MARARRAPRGAHTRPYKDINTDLIIATAATLSHPAQRPRTACIVWAPLHPVPIVHARADADYARRLRHSESSATSGMRTRRAWQMIGACLRLFRAQSHNSDINGRARTGFYHVLMCAQSPRKNIRWRLSEHAGMCIVYLLYHTSWISSAIIEIYVANWLSGCVEIYR